MYEILSDYIDSEEAAIEADRWADIATVGETYEYGENGLRFTVEIV